MKRKEIIDQAITGGLIAAAKSTTTALDREDVAAVAAKLQEVAGPAIDHATNAEAWWRSRVTIGSIAGILSGGLGLWGLVAAGVTDPEALATPIAGIFGGAFALWGRWAARRPLGQ
ncbi:hypothetical protein [Methylobrevis pamukkalensis]|uniref:Uncharacterized protein n=1 Tax=Methylobrevis pamukkalensis TaxID=1439726 RepID=A0A1E3GZU7_9HYPH|nr:hypothetical protein [Methylobrevis pamukkalensis]ODN69583.1 hypothetical protein A6302_03129 [Methylobrevis pamukkalensis]